MAEYRIEDISAGLRSFLTEIWKEPTQKFLLNYPDRITLRIDYNPLIAHLENKVGSDVENWIIDNPEKCIDAAETTLHEIAGKEFFACHDPSISSSNPADFDSPLHVRMSGYPSKTRIRNLTHDRIKKLVGIEGIVRRATTVRPKITTAALKCLRCGTINNVPQKGLQFVEPQECEEEACGKRGPFELVIDQSTYTDFQLLEIQESLDGLSGQQPRNIVVRVHDDLCDADIPVGEQVMLTGILEIEHERSGKDGKSTTYNYVIEAHNIEVDSNHYESLEISDQEHEEILRIAASDNLTEQIVGSIAPSVYGYSDIKQAMALQMFGGVRRSNDDGTKLRGDFHILMVGDPGVAKSQLLRNAADISPRGVFASGKSSTGAGLTAAVVKDGGLDSERWTVESGAMPLADGGVCAVDELDKMSNEDRSALHEGLEQQTIHINKAGINTHLRARTSMLGAANPKQERFDPNETLSSQIDMQPALISRFDLIFVLRDVPEKERDANICDHILKMHTSEGADLSCPTVDPLLLRKYIAYAKANHFPEISPECMKMIQDYFMQLRDSSKDGRVAITARHLEGLVRMAEASARMRLHDIADEHDAQVAIDLLHNCLSNLGVIGANGECDIDYIEATTTHNDREHIHTIHEYIVDMGAPVNALDVAQGTGIAQDIVERTLQKMARKGDIMRKDKGCFVAVS
jgi:replicative DNA helicase Mcm